MIGTSEKRTAKRPVRPASASTRTNRQPGAQGGVFSASNAEPKPTRAKLFQNGRSQAVRLPKAFRFEGKEVEIRHQGLSVILTPVMDAAASKQYWEQLFNEIDSLGPFDIPYCEDTTFVEPEDIFPEGW